MKEHLKTYTELSREVKADADRTTALLRFHGLVDIYGMPRDPKDKRSRNQREGHYAGRNSFYVGRKHSRTGPHPRQTSLRQWGKILKNADQGE